MSSLFSRPAVKSSSSGGDSSSAPNVDHVSVYVAGQAYTSGQTVILTKPGGTTDLYQCLKDTTTNPAADVAAAGGNWRQLTAEPQIGDYDATKQYYKGDLVRYAPVGARWPGIYLATGQAPTLGTAPASAAAVANTGWQAVVNPGPQLVLDTEVTNPALATISAVANIVAIRGGAGTALAAVTIPAGRRYRVLVTEPRPTTVGQSMNTDSVVRCYAGCAETQAADGTVSLVITPRWEAMSTAINTDLTAVAVNTLTARIQVELQ